MTSAKVAIYRTQTIRSCERMAGELLGLMEDELMARAGAFAFSTLKKLFPKVRRIAIFCGSGNNAGDGYVLARLARESGYIVTIHQYKHPENLPPAACHAALEALASGIPFLDLDEPIDSEVELVIDALLGTGLSGKVQGPIALAITQINDSGLPVIALDIPSGLDADTGKVLGTAVRADYTITFIAYKFGLLTFQGKDHSGQIFCHDLGLEKCLAKLSPAAFYLNHWKNHPLLPPRAHNSHKGDFGQVLVIGGNNGMSGAVYLAGLAALRTGAGSVTIATKQPFPNVIIPEIMVYDAEDPKELHSLLSKASVCVIGPGLGEDDWAEGLFKQALASQLPMVIDASALRLLAKNPQQDDNWVLTPHPGEAAQLLGCSTVEIQNDRYLSVLNLQAQYGGSVVLKGSGSLIATEEEVFLCSSGNPGMASAGMGDVLSGIIAGLIAQGLILSEAAQLGVWLHGKAGDLAAEEKGQRGLIASDLMPYLHQLVNT